MRFLLCKLRTPLADLEETLWKLRDVLDDRDLSQTQIVIKAYIETDYEDGEDDDGDE